MSDTKSGKGRRPNLLVQYAGNVFSISRSDFTTYCQSRIKDGVANLGDHGGKLVGGVHGKDLSLWNADDLRAEIGACMSCGTATHKRKDGREVCPTCNPEMFQTRLVLKRDDLE